mmetsp:Transcript_3585/g.9170  ORF Transcript_3585/g.9170 Transcript_3585/m.9170 type:complete len:99 (-) Transcript_3585:236-532(-)
MYRIVCQNTHELYLFFSCDQFANAQIALTVHSPISTDIGGVTCSRDPVCLSDEIAGEISRDKAATAAGARSSFCTNPRFVPIAAKAERDAKVARKSTS